MMVLVGTCGDDEPEKSAFSMFAIRLLPSVDVWIWIFLDCVAVWFCLSGGGGWVRGCGVNGVSRRSGAPGVGWAGLVGGSAATSGVVCGKGLCSVLVARML